MPILPIPKNVVNSGFPKNPRRPPGRRYLPSYPRYPNTGLAFTAPLGLEPVGLRPCNKS